MDRYPRVTKPDFGVSLKPQGKLWRDLTEDWLRLAITNSRDTTRARCPAHRAWQAISWVYVPFLDQPRLKRFHPQRLPREGWMLINGLGGLTSSRASRDIEDFGEGVGEYLHQAKQFHKMTGGDFHACIDRKVKARARKYNTPDNTKGDGDE